MHVFTYGSLMYRQVWDRVIAGGYRARVGKEVYPALLRGPAESAVPRGALP